MVKDLLVKISASVAGLKQGLSEAVTVTQSASNKIDKSSKNISGSLNQAFSGQFRGNIEQLNEAISNQRSRVNQLKRGLDQLRDARRDTPRSTIQYHRQTKAIESYEKILKKARRELEKLNISARDNKTALAASRLAAEDNSSAMEAMSRVTTALTGAVLLLGDENENLRPIMKGVRVAVASLNAVMAIQNLRLRENQFGVRLLAKAQSLWTTLTVGTTRAMTALKIAMASLGIGLLIAGIVGIVQNTDKFFASAKSLNEQLGYTDEEMKTLSQSAAKQTTEVNLLVRAVTDQTKSEKDRQYALDQLNKKYPNYFNNLTQDINDTVSLTRQKNKLIDTLIREARVRAAQEKITEIAANNINRRIEIQERLDKSNAELDKSNAELSESTKGLSVDQKDFTVNIDKYSESLNKNPEIQNKVTVASEKRLKALNEVNQAQLDLIKLNKEEEEQTKSLTSLIDFETAAINKNGGATETAAAKKAKPIKDNLALQEKAKIAETKLQGEKNLLLKKTDEERVRSQFITQNRLLDIQEDFAKQRLDLNKDDESAQLQYQATIDDINRQRLTNENNLNNELLRLKNEGIQNEAEAEKNRGIAIQESFEGTLAVYDRFYNNEKGLAAKAYNKGEIDLKEYKKRILEIELASANDRKQIYSDFGKDVSSIEQEIADINIKRAAAGLEKLTQYQENLARNSARVIRNALNSLFSDVGNLITDSFVNSFKGLDESAKTSLEILKLRQKELEDTMNDSKSSEMEILQARQQYLDNQKKITEASTSEMTKLFNGISMAIADFLIKLGSGLIAAAAATDAFQKLLTANPIAAIGVGVAALSLGAALKATISEGVAFANGGIVSGPTLGLVGEYAGASTNPEVIAPLSKLKTMLNLGENNNNGYIAETRISGRDLAIVLNRYNNDAKRG